MGIVRFDPFRELDRLQSEVNRIFEGYTGEPRAANAPRLWSPAVDIAEDDEAILVRAELPGMRQEDIDIELTGETLTLRGERRLDNEKENWLRLERAYGRFQRSFTLGVPVQNDRVSAMYRDGILEIRLPKSEALRPRKVPVTAAA